jgi:hypothetical protein
VKTPFLSLGTAIAALAAFAASIACADAAPANPQAAPASTADAQRVEIAADLPSVESRPYADLLQAMKDFDAWQATHPGTRLRFRVQARRDAAVAEGLKLWVADPVTRRRAEVALEPGGRFTLALSDEWREHGAVVRSNRPDGSLAWSVEVTHEGDGEHIRRLGDLRQECRLDLYAASLARGVKTPSFYAMKAATNLCASKLVGWMAYAERPVFAVHVQDGARRTSLRGDWLHGGDAAVVAFAPLLDWPHLLRDRSIWVTALMADEGWSDEAVLHMVFTDDAADGAAPVREGSGS